MTNDNGSNGNRLFFWIIGLLMPAFLGGVTSSVHLILTNAESIAVLKNQHQATERRLQHIEEKLDRLIHQTLTRNP